jgi:hypothetical protein
MGNTGGDRLIDWSGEFNTYLFPFNPNGMGAISRQLSPGLQQYLYQLAQSDGADPLFAAQYGSDPTRNGEPFGELGLVLSSDAGWNDQKGNPRDPQGLDKGTRDVLRTAGTLPIQSPGTAGQALGSSTTPLLSVPSGVTASNNTAAPLIIAAAVGSVVNYSVSSSGGGSLAGTVTIPAAGYVFLSLNLSSFTDGTLTYSAWIGSNPHVTATTVLSTKVPAAPTVSLPATVTATNVTAVPFSVTGAPGNYVAWSITDGTISDAGAAYLTSDGTATGTPTATYSTTLNLSQYSDGTISFQVTQQDAAGNISAAATPTVTKNTGFVAAPGLSLPASVNKASQTAVPLTITGKSGTTAHYTISDSSTPAKTITGTIAIPTAGTVTVSLDVSTLADGLITASAYLTDTSNHQSATTTTTTSKHATAPATPTVALDPTSDSGSSNSDYITKVTNPVFDTSAAPTGGSIAVYVNGTLYTNQTLAAGSYTVTAIATDQYGNTSATGTAAKTLVIVTAPPAGSFTVSGAKTIGGTVYTNSKTPTLTLSFTDAGGIYQMAASLNSTSFGTPVAYSSTFTNAVSLTADGQYTIYVQLTDIAGNTGTYSLNVTLKTAGPTITASLSAGQISSTTYDGTANITASYSATDPTGSVTPTATLDGVAFTGTTINIYTLTAGAHTLTITAVDALGNTSTKPLAFTIQPSLVGLRDAVNYGNSIGAVSKSEQTTLLSFLNTQTKTNLNNFIAACTSASGSKNLTAAEATLLKNWANDLLGRTTAP